MMCWRACGTVDQTGLLRCWCQLCSRHDTGRMTERGRYVVSWLSAVLAAFQFHGSNVFSSCRLVRPDTMRSSTSVSQASGSTSLQLRRLDQGGDDCPMPPAAVG